MKAERTVEPITFTPSEAKPGKMLYERVPKLNQNEDIVISGAAFQHRSDRRPRRQISRPERFEGAGGQGHSKIRGHHSSRHIWLRHLQNLRGSFPSNACALEQAAGRDSN